MTGMNDPSEPLKNARQERFACEVAKGAKLTAAFRLAGFKGDRREASLLGQNPNIQARVLWLKKEAAKSDVLTIAEKREFLARVLRTPLGEVSKDSDLCQEWSETVTKDGGSERIKMPDKLAAIKLDNDLAEDGAEASAARAISVMVRRAWADG